MSDWRPIDSAPKDGTEILVAYDPSVGWNNIVAWRYKANGTGAECWRDSYTLKRIWNTPTHWQPLPPPPGGEIRGNDAPDQATIARLEEDIEFRIDALCAKERDLFAAQATIARLEG